MLATQITTHVQDAYNRLMQQYKDLPQQFSLTLRSTGETIPVSGISGMLAAYVDQLQELENALFALDEGRQLYNGTTFPAVGAQLDVVGQIVGVARNGLGDSEYLIFILGTIAENNSDDTIDAVTTVVSLLFQVQTFLAFEMFPAEMDFQIPNTTNLTPDLYNKAFNIINNSLGAGIGLGFISLYSPTNAFRCTFVGGPQIGGGFGDVNNPAVGGELAANIFNNPGV